MKPNTSFVFALIVALVVMAAEGSLVYLLFKSTLSLPLFITLHLAVSLALSLWAILADMFRYDVKFPLLFLILNLTMGVFGAGICLVMIVLYAVYSRHSTAFADWYASLFPDNENTHHNALYDRLVMGWEDFSEKSGMVPYMDVMILGSDKQKQAALEKITGHFTPELAPVLIKALEDPKNSIRVQAATVLAKLEQEYAHKAVMIERKLRKQPKSSREPKLILQLAKHYDTFAHAGFILDKEREVSLRHKAILFYEYYLELVPDDGDVPFYLGWLYLQDHHIDKAYALLRRSVEERGNPTPLHVWCYMECLYRKQDFDTLKQVARTYFPQMDTEDSDAFKIVEMVRLWGGGIVGPLVEKEASI